MNYNEKLFNCIENEVGKVWSDMSINQISATEDRLNISIMNDNYVEYTEIRPKEDKIALEMTHDLNIGFIPKWTKELLIEKLDIKTSDICNWGDLDFIDGEWVASAYCGLEKEIEKIDDPQKMCQIIADSNNFNNEIQTLKGKIEREGSKKLVYFQNKLNNNFINTLFDSNYLLFRDVANLYCIYKDKDDIWDCYITYKKEKGGIDVEKIFVQKFELEKVPNHFIRVDNDQKKHLDMEGIMCEWKTRDPLVLKCLSNEYFK